MLHGFGIHGVGAVYVDVLVQVGVALNAAVTVHELLLAGNPVRV
jgi:hypothetical protein